MKRRNRNKAGSYRVLTEKDQTVFGGSDMN